MSVICPLAPNKMETQKKSFLNAIRIAKIYLTLGLRRIREKASIFAEDVVLGRVRVRRWGLGQGGSGLKQHKEQRHGSGGGAAG